MGKKLTQDEIRARCKQTHGDKYTYPNLDSSTKTANKIIVKCTIHGEFEQVVSEHLRGRGCVICGNQKKAYTQEEFIQAVSEKHKDSNLIYKDTVYRGSTNKINVLCGRHGRFAVTASTHLEGLGCLQCSAEAKLQETHKSFIKRSMEIHDNKYDYDLVKYIHNRSYVKIKCKKHGVFDQVPQSHLQGRGCPQCALDGAKISHEDFVRRAEQVHNGIYDYSMATYENYKEKMQIICPSHGAFWQTPDSHVNQGSGCPHCKKYISKAETEWLNILGIPIQHRQKQFKINNKRYNVDAYIENENTIYEFFGDFWHGNIRVFKPGDLHPYLNKTFFELYSEAMDRLDAFTEAGYNVVFVWEEDFEKGLMFSEKEMKE